MTLNEKIVLVIVHPYPAAPALADSSRVTTNAVSATLTVIIVLLLILLVIAIVVTALIARRRRR